MRPSGWATLFAGQLAICLILAAVVQRGPSLLFVIGGFFAWIAHGGTVSTRAYDQGFAEGRKAAYDDAAALDDALNYGRDE